MTAVCAPSSIPPAAAAPPPSMPTALTQSALTRMRDDDDTKVEPWVEYKTFLNDRNDDCGKGESSSFSSSSSNSLPPNTVCSNIGGRKTAAITAVSDSLPTSPSKTITNNNLGTTSSTSSTSPRSSIERVRWSDVHVGRLIGKGGFCDVHSAAVHRWSTDEELVIKLVRTKNAEVSPTALRDLQTEARILLHLGNQHPHILQLRGLPADSEETTSLNSSSNTTTTTTSPSPLPHPYFLILPRLEDTLDSRLRLWRKKQQYHQYSHNKKQRVAWLRHKIETVVRSIASALDHLHQHHVLHRDIKPQNVGFDCGDRVMLFDFGLSKNVEKEEEEEEKQGEDGGNEHDAGVGIGQNEEEERIRLHSEHQQQTNQGRRQQQQQQSLDYQFTVKMTDGGGDDDDDEDYNDDELPDDTERQGHDPDGAGGGDREGSEQATKLAGTPRYMSPEVFDQGAITTAADIYSFGVLLYEILTLKVPFRRYKTPQSLRDAVVDAGYRPSLPNCSLIRPSTTLQRIIEACWQHPAKLRPTAAEILMDLDLAMVELSLTTRKDKKQFGEVIDSSIHSHSGDDTVDVSERSRTGQRLKSSMFFGRSGKNRQDSSGAMTANRRELIELGILSGDEVNQRKSWSAERALFGGGRSRGKTDSGGELTAEKDATALHNSTSLKDDSSSHHFADPSDEMALNVSSLRHRRSTRGRDSSVGAMVRRWRSLSRSRWSDRDSSSERELAGPKREKLARKYKSKKRSGSDHHQPQQPPTTGVESAVVAASGPSLEPPGRWQRSRSRVPRQSHDSSIEPISKTKTTLKKRKMSKKNKKTQTLKEDNSQQQHRRQSNSYSQDGSVDTGDTCDQLEHSEVGQERLLDYPVVDDPMEPKDLKSIPRMAQTLRTLTPPRAFRGRWFQTVSSDDMDGSTETNGDPRRRRPSHQRKSHSYNAKSGSSSKGLSQHFTTVEKRDGTCRRTSVDSTNATYQSLEPPRLRPGEEVILSKSWFPDQR